MLSIAGVGAPGAPALRCTFLSSFFSGGFSAFCTGAGVFSFFFSSGTAGVATSFFFRSLSAFWTGFDLSSRFFSSGLSAFWTGAVLGLSSFFLSSGLSAFWTGGAG